jgi:hypothetical protein
MRGFCRGRTMADGGTLRHRARCDAFERELVLSRVGYRILRDGNDVYKNMPVGASSVLAALELVAAESPSSAPPGHLLPVEDGEKGVREDALVEHQKSPDPTACCLLPVKMQPVAMRLQPAARHVRLGTQQMHQRPETAAMVHLLEMRHLMGRDIVEDEGRRQDQPPGIG